MSKEQTSQSMTPMIAAGGSVLLVIGAIALVTMDQLAGLRGRGIEDAPQPPLTLMLVSGFLLILSTCWAVWLVKNHGFRHLASMVVTAIAAILLIVTPVFAWQGFTSSRNLNVISMTCDAAVLANPGASSTTDCTESAVETIVLLEGVESDKTWVPDSSTGNLTRTFEDLPAGRWKTTLTVDGPPETVTVAAIKETENGTEKIGSFRPYLDTESQRLRWSATIPVDTDVDTIRVLFYLSPNPVVQSASIRFNVMECPGQVARNLDASQCAPFTNAPAFVREHTPEQPRTWRHPQITRQDSTLVATNLEVRTYVLEPDFYTIESFTQSTDVLIIPSAMPQEAENTISEPGANTFEVTINEQSGAQEYTVYIFPSGPTYAQSSSGEDS